ncbi:hypothetical protein M8C21_017494, partial [Ambrosia artemisiifolia]
MYIWPFGQFTIFTLGKSLLQQRKTMDEKFVCLRQQHPLKHQMCRPTMRSQMSFLNLLLRIIIAFWLQKRKV